MRALEEWVEGPLEVFLGETGARMVLVTTMAGQVVAQHGFVRAVDLMSVAALAAAVAASTDALARQREEAPGQPVVHQGREGGYVLGRAAVPGGPWLCLAAFGPGIPAGVVRLFVDRLATDLMVAAPAGRTARAPLAADFERELAGSLQALFGR